MSVLNDIGVYLDLQDRMRQLGKRWVMAWEGMTNWQSYTVHVTDVNRTMRTFTISWHHCDGIAYNSTRSLSLDYLDDSSTLEIDARTIKADLYAKQRAEQDEIDALRADPNVKRYLAIEYQRSQLTWPYMANTRYVSLT